MATAWQKQSGAGAEESSWSCLGLFSKNRTSLIYNNLGIFFLHLENYTVFIEKLNREELKNKIWIKFLKWSKMTFTYCFTKSWYCLIILNRTRNFFPAPAPNCICPAGLPSWSVTIILNRTSPYILPLCKVLFPGSHLPLKNYGKDCSETSKLVPKQL